MMRKMQKNSLNSIEFNSGFWASIFLKFIASLQE